MTSAAAEKSAPAEALLTAGTTSEYLPVELSIVTYGFSAIVGVAATVVNGPTVGSADPLGAGPQCDGGAPSTPLKTMFQTPPPPRADRAVAREPLLLRARHHAAAAGGAIGSTR